MKYGPALSSKRRAQKTAKALVVVATLGLGIGLFSARSMTPGVILPGVVLPPVSFSPLPRLSRPYGMAPQAFDAYVRACSEAKIHPWRIGQTIGDHPLSAGYHKRDGVLKVNGQPIDYTAAIDLGTYDLDRADINRFLAALTKQGFACWYREKGHWKGREHIHAIYAQLPMKRQLRGQVREFLNERRERGVKALPWERKVRRRL